MSYRFITESLETNINDNVLSTVFPKLIPTQKLMLSKYLITIIDVIAYIYRLSGEDFIHQLQQNNYQDAKWLLLYLVPHLNTDPSSVTDLNDIYTSKLKNVDINKIAPRYKYSNLQYGRCKRNDIAEEIQFSEEHIRHNFYLLLDTIRTSSHKMYVNWMDVVPYARKDIETSFLYRATMEDFNDSKISDWNPIDVPVDTNDVNTHNELKKKLSGLYVGDLYNTIRTYLFEDIKTIKWLLYDVVVTTTYPVPGLYMLYDVFMVDDASLITAAIRDVKWSELTDRQQEQFDIKWKDLVDHAVNHMDYDVINFSIMSLSVERFVKSIISVFNNHYAKNNKKVLSSGYVMINDDKVTDDEDASDLALSDVIESIKSLKSMYLYDFIRRDLQTFKYTYYGTSLLTYDKTDLKEEYSYISDMVSDVSDRDTKISHKNLYNFCKSLVHYADGDKYIPFPKNWKMLEASQQTEFLKRINNKYPDVMNWFNIGRYLQYLNKNIGDDRSTIRDKNIKIYTGLRKCFIKVIFDTLVTKGILSRFIPNKRVTDGAYTSRDKIHTRLADTVFNKSGSFWRDSYYYITELPYSLTGSFIDGDKEHDIFTYNSQRAWYGAYALDWISQIGFCHHFIHNRVSYITGATGVGKSTQVPKLFMYYMKAIDYNTSGRVVCTQPRKTPTIKNASIVSTELGVPIYSKGKDTSNYYIQMKYRGKEHIKKVNHATLKYVTDGSLIQELRDPLVKEKRSSGKYTMTNLYDIIIIDEAHEHNKYMDMLLTILRDPTYYNNSVRLVILSATMDEDEPVYRRFYRGINDNRKYPLDCWLRDNAIDRINVDRRFHISPPGKATKHKITDIYVPDGDPLVIINNMLRSGLDGDVLVFQPGRKEIDETVNRLNEILPGNVIALPYHSQLESDKREYIETIDDNITNLRIDKMTPYESAENLEKGNGFYNHFIIVATNIAEASITIKTLKYVIETGTQKTNIYNYVRRGEILQKTNISESSRLQRRGRVGRTSSGTVYYMYEDGKMENNKTQYNISIENISNDLYSRLRIKHDESEFLSVDPTIAREHYAQIALDPNYGDIFTALYTTVAGYYTYFGYNTHYDYENNRSPTDISATGYSSRTLTDNAGQFYIVHPEELYINRDIIGRIVGSTKKDIVFKRYTGKVYGEIVSKKLESFWEDFILMNFLTPSMDKTEFGVFVMDALESVQFDNISLGRAFIHGLLFNVSQPMTRIVSMLIATGGDIKKLLLQDIYYRYNLDEVRSKIDNSDSDIKAFNILADDLLRYLSIKSDTFNIDNIIGRLAKDFNLRPATIKRLIYDHIYDDPDIDDTDRDKILAHAFDNIMMDATTIELIRDWSKTYSVNASTMVNFVSEYLHTNDKISKLYHPDENHTDYSEYIQRLKKNYGHMIDADVDPIKLSFCLAMPYNICKNISSTNRYINIYSPTIDNIYSIQSLTKKRYMPATFTSSIYVSNYIFYTSVNVEFGTIYCVGYLPLKYLKYLGDIYKVNRIEKISNITDLQRIREYIDERSDKIVPADYKVLVDINKTYGELIRDIQSYV